MIIDPAECVLNTAICALRDLFTPGSDYPPLGGGATHVRTFAGDAPPMAAFDFHTNDPDCGCEQPFLWIRLMRRFRTRTFPQPFSGADPCGVPPAVAVEVGIARCSQTAAPDCDWSAYEAEAEVGLDDSWRIERALCVIAQRLRNEKCSDMVATDAVVPYGPEGGVIGWVGTFTARTDT